MDQAPRLTRGPWRDELAALRARVAALEAERAQLLVAAQQEAMALHQAIAERDARIRLMQDGAGKLVIATMRLAARLAASEQP